METNTRSVEELLQEIDQLKETISRHKLENRKSSFRLTAEIATNKKLNQELEEEITKQKELNQKRQQEIANLKKLGVSVTNLTADIEKKIKMVEQLNTDILEKRKELDFISSHISETKSKIDRFNKEKSKLEAELARLQELSELNRQDIANEMKQIRKEIDNLQELINQKEQLIDKLKELDILFLQQKINRKSSLWEISKTNIVLSSGSGFVAAALVAVFGFSGGNFSITNTIAAYLLVWTTFMAISSLVSVPMYFINDIKEYQKLIKRYNETFADVYGIPEIAGDTTEVNNIKCKKVKAKSKNPKQETQQQTTINRSKQVVKKALDTNNEISKRANNVIHLDKLDKRRAQ